MTEVDKLDFVKLSARPKKNKPIVKKIKKTPQVSAKTIAVKPTTATLTPRNMLEEFKTIKTKTKPEGSKLAKKHAKVIKTLTKKD